MGIPETIAAYELRLREVQECMRGINPALSSYHRLQAEELVIRSRIAALNDSK